MGILHNCAVLIVCVWIPAQALFFKRDNCCPEVGGECFDADRHKYKSILLPNCFLPLFTLYTREIRDASDEKKYEGVSISKDTIPAEFLPDEKTVMIVHGWNDGPDETPYSWLYTLRDALLVEADINVIIMDWTSNSKTPLMKYPVAVADTRVAGKAIHDLFSVLYTQGLDRNNSHCIGHSLGAHVCGFAGQYQPIGRITGLDPAGPRFEKLVEEARLSKDDADFVDVIHTDGGGFALLDYGTLLPMGDVDFYPNGGRNQRGCKMNRRRRSADIDQLHEDSPVLVPHAREKRVTRNKATEQAFSLLGCSHMRAIWLYVTSLTTDCLRATATCAVATSKYLGFCIRLKDQSAYPLLGYRTDPSTEGLYHLTTGGQEPFCNAAYQQQAGPHAGHRGRPGDRRGRTRPGFIN